MYIEILNTLRGSKLEVWKNFLQNAGLEIDTNVNCTVLIWEERTLIATGSRLDNIIKCIAIAPERQGEDIASLLLTALRRDAFEAGSNHLFLYTKPQNEKIFSSLFFYKIAQTDKVLLMENKKDGIKSFVNSLDDEPPKGKVGAIVMNCNPFTLGHRYLIETASKECDKVYVFVVSEDKSYFSTKDRMAMVKAGTKDISNVKVLPTDYYLISSATFPTYFLKDTDGINEVKCMLDIEVFANHFAPALGITHRYVGTEPECEVTRCYNELLKANLPKKGICVHEVPRLKKFDIIVSASDVRKLTDLGDIDYVRELVPRTTFEYMISNNLLY